MKQLLKFLLFFLPTLWVAFGGLYAQKPASAISSTEKATAVNKKAVASKQGQGLIDSLLAELPKAKEDTNKVKILNSLTYGYSNIDPDEGIKYGLQNMALAQKLQWKKGIASAYANLGTIYWSKSEDSKALENYLAALKIDEETGNKKAAANVTLNMGNVCHRKGDYAKALEYYLKSLKMSEGTGNKQVFAGTLVNIGSVYNDQGEYSKALEYYFKALGICEASGDKSTTAIVTGNIGNVYLARHEYPKALEYYFKQLKMDKELGIKNFMARANGDIACVYYAEEDYAKALEYYLKDLELSEETGDKNGVAAVIANISSVYTRQKNYLMAIPYAKTALKMDQELGDKRQEAIAFDVVGDAYLSLAEDTTSARGKVVITPEAHLKKYIPDDAVPTSKSARLSLAISYLRRGLELAKNIHIPEETRNAYENLARAYKLSGNYRLAMENYQNYIIIKDSVFSNENDKKMMKTAMQYDYDRQHLADSLKNAEKEKINTLRLQRQRSYTYMGIAGALLLLGFSFFMLRNNKLLGEEKKRSDDLLLNILPAEVAIELKDKGSAAARHYDNVTVLFTDFVNFTQAGEKMSPQALIDELHACFKTFDEITAKYNIEKIKTIGDAYLAVAGLPTADACHAEHIVQAAVEINNFMTARYAKLGNNTFEIRIGIHSGSVVAGIVGVKKFAYDIWGDTVNTAARMEQNSEAGKINISEATYELVKGKFACEYRGEIDAKNKGMLKMYYVRNL